jgi:hypothetical protein
MRADGIGIDGQRLPIAVRGRVVAAEAMLDRAQVGEGVHVTRRQPQRLLEERHRLGEPSLLGELVGRSIGPFCLGRRAIAWNRGARRHKAWPVTSDARVGFEYLVVSPRPHRPDSVDDLESAIEASAAALLG